MILKAAHQSWEAFMPSPQFSRPDIRFLSGPWQMNGQPIRVPFPPQAPASGWQGDVPEEMIYETAFDVPEPWLKDGLKVLLHIGAVDQEASVTLNGQALGGHRGGYLPFQMDITAALRKTDNRLQITARDTLDHTYPYGKQSKNPHGMWYTPVSGIWQCVWLESVPRSAVTSLTLVPDLEGLTLTVNAPGSGTAQVTIGDNLTCSCPVNTAFRIQIPDPRPWSPEDPYLYPLTVTWQGDTVKSYFGLRTVSIKTLPDGTQRICLNGKPLFLFGVLDQGYHPQGLFLPQSPADYDQDVLRAKSLGINLLRKHVKIEPEAFYEACDRLGILVLQDMVNSGPYHYLPDTVLPTVGLKYRPGFLPGSRRRRDFFVNHCLDTQNQLRNHPCVIGYTIFNEGWGQFDTSRIYEKLKSNDPARLYLSYSGWFKGYRTDICGEHIYFKERILHAKGRPLLISECGGFTLDLNGTAAKKSYGYGATDSKEALTQRIRRLMNNMVLPSVKNGLNGVVYTQLTDVEGEINGLYTYDRSECKVIPEDIIKMAEDCHEAFDAACAADSRR